MPGPWPRARKPPLNSVGEDPDYRFSLANERTFLAWIRTSLGLLAGGVAVVQLVDFGVRGGRTVIGATLIILALLLAAASYLRWERNERAMRLHRPLPRSPVPLVVAAGLGVVAATVLLLVIYAANTAP